MAVANNLNINDEIVLDCINKTALIAEQSNYSVDAMHSMLISLSRRETHSRGGILYES